MPEIGIAIELVEVRVFHDLNGCRAGQPQTGAPLFGGVFGLAPAADKLRTRYEIAFQPAASNESLSRRQGLRHVLYRCVVSSQVGHAPCHARPDQMLKSARQLPVTKLLSVMVWLPLSSTTKISKSNSVSAARNAAGTVTSVMSAGRSMVNSSPVSSLETMTL